MITKDLLKSEIDKVPDENLGVLYRIVKVFAEAAQDSKVGRPDETAWKASLAEAYGSTADAPLERGQQGTCEVRGPLE